jgi:hypothetical protein
MNEGLQSRYDLSHLLSVGSVGRSVAIHRGQLVQGLVRGARIVDGDFRNWQVYDSEFVGCTFVRCHWRDSDFKNSVFRSCVLIDCTFDNERFGITEIEWVDSVRETQVQATAAHPSIPQSVVLAPDPAPVSQPAPAQTGKPSRFFHLEK